ncbi:hypothetical protein [Streptomyces albidoflavus]|uniref:hypothetical protein n=1 Tax=Streptomyces albidoflavus TaxID=1886 RepID=UPI00344BA999
MTALEQVPHGVLVAAENDATVSVAERHEFRSRRDPRLREQPERELHPALFADPDLSGFLNSGEDCGTLPIQEQHTVWDHEHGIG